MSVFKQKIKNAINAIGNAAKKLLNVVKSPMGENNFSAPSPLPICYRAHFLSGRLRSLGPLGRNLKNYDIERLSGQNATPLIL